MMRLHGYWRSTASYRVRIALTLKGLSYDQVTHDLRTGAQQAEDFRALNPQMLVPAVDTGDTVLTQSGAILEWLDACYPAPPLLPADAAGRAQVRAMAALIACDIHPLNNLRVLAALRREFGATDAQVNAWISRWITEGFAALEVLITRHGGGFAYGAVPTLADCYVVPQVYSAERFNIPLAAYPHVLAAAERMRALPAVAAAHPARQPDADQP